MKHKWEKIREVFGHRVVISDGQFYPKEKKKLRPPSALCTKRPISDMCNINDETSISIK
jgi:hypothetical protein